MATLTINDLDVNVELDKKALAAVTGGSNYAFFSYSSWRLIQDRKRFLSNVYVSGQGWKKRYQIDKVYHRHQYYYRGYELVA